MYSESFPEWSSATCTRQDEREWQAKGGGVPGDDLAVIFATGSGPMHVDLVDRPVAAIDPSSPDLLAAIAAVLPAPMLSSSEPTASS